MKRTLSMIAAVVALLALATAALDRLAAADPIPVEQQPYTYVITTTNGGDADAGTAHEIFFSGEMAFGNVSGSFAVSLEPNGTSQNRIGPYEVPLNSLSMLLNGLEFNAPDNWKPMRIRVVEQLHGVDTRVVVDHDPWTMEFNNDQRSHQIFDEMMPR